MSDFIALVFILSFALVAVLLWYLAARPADGTQNSRGRPPLAGPLAVAAGILGGGSLITMILVGFTPTGRTVMAATPAILTVLVVAALGSGGILIWRSASGKPDAVTGET